MVSHSTLGVIIDLLLSICVCGDKANHVFLDLDIVEEVRAIQVGSIVSLLEVLVEHFEGHLSHSLPSLEPLGDVFHLIIDADPGVVDGVDSLGVSRKALISEIAPITHSSVVKAPFLVINTSLSQEVVGQHDIVLKDNLFLRCAGVDTVVHKGDVVSNGRVSQVDLGLVRRFESSGAGCPLI